MCVCPSPAVTSSRYEVPSGGAIEVISPANSPAQAQQEKQQQDDRERADRDRAAQAATQGKKKALYCEPFNNRMSSQFWFA